MCMCAGNDRGLEQKKGTSAKSTAKARTALSQKTPNQTKKPNLQYCVPNHMQRQLKYKLCIPCFSLFVAHFMTLIPNCVFKDIGS